MKRLYLALLIAAAVPGCSIAEPFAEVSTQQVRQAVSQDEPATDNEGDVMDSAPEMHTMALGTMSRDEIIAHSKSGMGYSYWWGHARWDPNGVKYAGRCSGSCPGCRHSATGGGPEYGADCSGFTAKVWQVPSATAINKDSHPYSTRDFRYSRTHWDAVARKDMKPGDALVYRNSANTGGHVMIFESWNSAGKGVVYECASCSLGCLHRTRSVASNYIGIRRKSLTDKPPNKKPRGNLDSANAEQIKGWAQDEDVKDKPIEVHIYFDGAAGTANAKGFKVTADKKRDDLCSSIGSCNHGFTFDVPEQFRDGKPHAVYAYGIDSAGGPNTLLVGSPKTIRFDEQPAQCTNDGQCAPGEQCVDGKCEAPQSAGSCFGEGYPCPSGYVCAWNGDGYCCRVPGAGSQACFADSECGDNICAYNGSGFFCVKPVTCK